MQIVDVTQKGEPLERPDADMAMAEPCQHRRAGGGRLIAALERFARLNECEALGCIDPERFEHLGRKDFANAALQCQAAIGTAAVGRRAGTFRSKVEQSPVFVTKLRKRKAAAVSDFRVIHSELMAVIA